MLLLFYVFKTSNLKAFICVKYILYIDFISSCLKLVYESILFT